MVLAEIRIEIDLFGALLILPLILLIGWFGARMLGVRESAVRVFLTGMLGWFFGLLIAGLTSGNDPSAGEFLIRVIPFSILSTMAFAIAFDFIAKPGSKDPYERLGRLPKLPHPVRRMKRTTGPPLRFREVLSIARREGLLHRRFASGSGIA